MIVRLKNFAVFSCLLLVLAACAKPQMVPGTNRPVGLLEPDLPTAPVIRQPVLPELLVACRGHVLVPSLGMTFIQRGGDPPPTGQFLREERISAPYRIIPPGARLSVEQNPQRLNVELDQHRRIIGLYCG